MKTEQISQKNMDVYIQEFPEATREILEKIRATIKNIAPEAEETIGYGIPTFKLKGNLVHFAGYDHHIGFYPGSSGIAHFQEELAEYKTAKGSVQFPLNQPIPYELITKIVKFRIRENLEKSAEKRKK